MDECDGGSVGGAGDVGVGSGPGTDAAQRFGGLGGGIHLNFGAEARRGEDVVSDGGVVLDGAEEIFVPLLDLAGVCIDPIEMRLEVAVGAGDITLLSFEEDVAAVSGPTRVDFNTLIGSDAAGSGCRGGIVCASCGEGGPPHIDDIDFHVFVFFLPLVDRVADESELGAIGRDLEAVNAQRSGRDSARAGSEIGLFVGLPFFLFNFRRSGRVAGESCGDIEGEDRVAAFGGAVLDDVFLLLLVVVFLRVCPRLAGREINRLGIWGP